MTPKEKALELVYKYYTKMNPDAPDCNISFSQCKQCALIAVDEIMYCLNMNNDNVYFYNPEYEYYKEVKQEIEKI